MKILDGWPDGHPPGDNEDPELKTMSLTDEDKEWMLRQFASRASLVELANQVEKLPTKFPTQADLEALVDKIERVETSLLTEFHKWASPMEQRLRTQQGSAPCS